MEREPNQRGGNHRNGQHPSWGIWESKSDPLPVDNPGPNIEGSSPGRTLQTAGRTLAGSSNGSLLNLVTVGIKAKATDTAKAIDTDIRGPSTDTKRKE